MQYRPDKRGDPLSVLGFGCMRLPRGADGVDMKKAEPLILSAVEGGVNYFDTAYIYPGSEAALGEILARNGLRDQVRITTKLPHYLLKKPQDLDRYFEEQLRRLQTDHVDYYLMHMLTDPLTWRRLEDLGIRDWLASKKASGAIGQVGFSYHGGSDAFCALVDVYDWDLCMIQYNYMDVHSQAGQTGLHYAAEKGLPVMIMEPLRGGRLSAGLPKQAKERFARYPLQRSPAAWSFHWLWDQPEVTCVLSGMNTPEILAENLREADAACAGSMTDDQRALLEQVVVLTRRRQKVDCTGCRYCMPCPHHVDIPGAFSAYNRVYTDSWYQGMKAYIMCTTLRKQSAAASQCVGCGLCERHCPQGIPIRRELDRVRRKMEGPLYQIGRRILLRGMKV